jgi:sugar phosphate isomerase/epimerase
MIYFGLKKTVFLFTCLSSALCCAGAADLTDARDDSDAESLGWQLGVQAWTFKNFTFFDAVDNAADMGLKYIEAFPGQLIDGATGDTARIDTGMSTQDRERVKKKLADAGVKFSAFGVITPGTGRDWSNLFAFAQDMQIPVITSEPAPDQLDLVEKLCGDFKINLAIHNHPKPSRYWNPDTVLKVMNGRSKRIGFCADTGHWRRSGLDPVACLKKCAGRIICLHFKDLNREEVPAHDVPWGTGVNNVWAMLSELKRQKFRGGFSIEYEHNWDNSMPEIRQCIQYFDLAAAALSDDGYAPLFSPDLSNALYTADGWLYSDGVLAGNKKGDIWTENTFGDCILDLEFKTTRISNSGIFLRCGSIQNWLHSAIEIQVMQPIPKNPKHSCGAIYDVLAPEKQMVKQPGEWNRYIIIARGSRLYVIFNGTQVIDCNLDLWTEAHKNPDGTPNKFNTAYKDMPRTGHIGLQDHGTPIWFKNLRIKRL